MCQLSNVSTSLLLKHGTERLITLKHLTAFSSPIQLLDLRKDFVLDQRVLRRDLLRVESRVKSLLSFDTRSVYQEGVV